MSKRREREPFATVNLPEFPAWGRPYWRPRMAHLYYLTLRDSRRPRVMSICGNNGVRNPLDLDIAHPDDRRCKMCLAWEAKHAKEDA